MSVVFISGSPSADSRSARLLDLARQRVVRAGEATEFISVRDLSTISLLHARFQDEALAAAIRLVETASAVVIATPVYKAAYSGVLKAFLDLLPQTGFSGKTVLPIATAGSPAHTLALDYALRPVIAALGARDVIPGVFAIDTQLHWNEEGKLQLDPEIDKRLDAAVASLLAQVRRAEREALLQREAEAPAVHFSTVRYSA